MKERYSSFDNMNLIESKSEEESNEIDQIINDQKADFEQILKIAEKRCKVLEDENSKLIKSRTNLIESTTGMSLIMILMKTKLFQLYKQPI